ncbi:MAG: tryptophan--tRNA ligase, partial [Planctomycetes bacterium RBG_16_59_8]
ILSCITPVGWLERCPTYKEQKQQVKEKDLSNYAFLGYPVLMTADIVLYRAEVVPVGEDQVPHLEICREIVRRFNSYYGDVFPEPQPKLTPTPRIAGLDGRKMSKPYGNDIALSDDPESIRKKVMTMFTDPARVRKNDPGHPEICNVYTFHGLVNAARTGEIARDCRAGTIGCTSCKAELAEKLAVALQPIREKRAELLADRRALNAIVEKGCERARAVAEETMRDVKKALFKSGA